MMDNNSGRTWSNAPGGVRDARALAWLGAFFSGLLLLVAIVMLATNGFPRDSDGAVGFLFFALFFPFYVWLLSGLKRGVKAAYYVQMVISIIGVLGFPIGTLINGYILFKWFKPETKAWFGV